MIKQNNMYKYTYSKNDKTITINHSIFSLRMNVIQMYLLQGYEIVRIELDGVVIMEKL